MSEENRKSGRVTIPTDVDVVPETLEILKRWGADAIRDCDGTDYPEALKSVDAKVYSTYYTTRKDNAWAKANPDEVQQCYIMTGFYPAVEDTLSIPLMKGISDELMKVNTRDDIKRWWEVIDRTSGEVVDTANWDYDENTGCVVIKNVEKYHDYTVSFLAYLIWDPVHMYNAVTNNWQNFEHQITFDVRQPKTHKYTMERLRRFIAEHPYVNVIRYTTFFHQFTLIFDELKRERYVDWYGYSASVSPLHSGAVREGSGLQVPSRVHHRPGLLQQPVPCAQQGVQGLPGLPAPRGGQVGQGDGGTSPTSWARKP